LTATSELPSSTALDPRALRLGYAGLVPFVVGAALMWLVLPDARLHVSKGLTAYAAVIVSFLGGIHWGLGFRQQGSQPASFAWGVAPSLVSWIALMMSPDAALIVLGVMLVVSYLVDRKVYPLQGARGWLTLRFRLSVVASLCCFIGAAGS
jgi:amino acid transporter